MRVLCGFAFRMMFAMHSHPFTGALTGAHPQPEAENMPQYRIKIETSVSLIAMQIERDAHDGELHHQESQQGVTPESKVQEPAVVGIQKFEHAVASLRLRRDDHYNGTPVERKGTGWRLASQDASAAVRHCG